MPLYFGSDCCVRRAPVAHTAGLSQTMMKGLNIAFDGLSSQSINYSILDFISQIL